MNTRKFTMIIVMTVVIIFSVIPASAQAPAGEWVSSFSCINQDEFADAGITIKFYQENNPTPVLSYDDTIAPQKTKNYFTPSSPTGIPDPFLGSVVISSSSPISCQSKSIKVSVGSSSNPFRYGLTGGFAEVDTGPIMYATQVERHFYYWNSYIAIQNTTANAVDVTVEYTNRFGNAFPAATEQINIPGYSNKVLYQDSNAGLGEMFIGSAKITADDGTTPLAVTVSNYNNARDYKNAQFHEFSGVSSGAPQLSVPYLLRNYYGYGSGLMIVNVGSTATSFRVKFIMGGSTYVYQHGVELAPGENKDLYLPDVAVLRPVDSKPISQRFGYAVIEATDISGTLNPAASLAANVNQTHYGVYTSSWAGRGGTYNAFPFGSESNILFMPNAMNHVAGFSSGFHIANPSDTDGFCDIIFPDDPDANILAKPIAANGYFSYWVPNVANLDLGYDSGVIFDCSVGVVGIGNMTADGSTTYGDSFAQMNLPKP